MDKPIGVQTKNKSTRDSCPEYYILVVSLKRRSSSSPCSLITFFITLLCLIKVLYSSNKETWNGLPDKNCFFSSKNCQNKHWLQCLTFWIHWISEHCGLSALTEAVSGAPNGAVQSDAEASGAAGEAPLLPRHQKPSLHYATHMKTIAIKSTQSSPSSDELFW